MEGILLGKRVRLGAIDPEKASLTNEWFNDPYITRNLSWGVQPMRMELSEAFMNENKKPSAKERIFSIHALDLPDEEESYIGHIGLHKIDWQGRMAELGIIIGKREHLNKGYGQEAIHLLLHFAFMEMNLHRVYLRHKSFNERGHHAYLKTGFKEEGRLRQHEFRNGRYWDVILMGILREEFMNNKH